VQYGENCLTSIPEEHPRNWAAYIHNLAASHIDTLEANHHVKNDGSLWMMINLFFKNDGSETNP